MYSIDKCVGIPDLLKHAAVPKREGGGGRGKQFEMCLLYVHHHKCRWIVGGGGDNMKLKLTQ